MCCYSKSRHSNQIWCKSGQLVKERHHFFEIQDGGSRHVEFRFKAFSNIIDVLLFKIITFSHILVKDDQKVKKWLQLFFKFKMVAAAMLDFGYKAFSDIKHVLLFKATTFPPNLMTNGQMVKERILFFLIQDGGSRHVGF